MSEPLGTQVAKKPDDPKAIYTAFVDRLTTQVIGAMPISVPEEDLKRARARFRVTFSADAQRQLMSCTADSVGRAILLSAMSGLYPGGPRPDVWLIPRKNKHNNDALEVNWQMGYRGYIRLARRAGWDIEPVVVYHGEKFSITEGDAPRLIHEVDPDCEHTWDSMRGVYCRVFQIGKKEEMKFAYLSKAEVLKRRNKAQDQNVWNDWPIEQTYKTICSYAGAREMFPCDDPSRYAMVASEQAEIGAGVSNADWQASLPAGTKTANLAARLTAAPTAVAPVTEGRPLDTVAVAEEVGETFSTVLSEPVGLSVSSLAELRQFAASAPVVPLKEIEARIKSPLDRFRGEPGESEADVAATVRGVIEIMKTKGGK